MLAGDYGIGKFTRSVLNTVKRIFYERVIYNSSTNIERSLLTDKGNDSGLLLRLTLANRDLPH